VSKLDDLGGDNLIGDMIAEVARAHGMRGSRKRGWRLWHGPTEDTD
jgi:hypothetical protein